MPRLLRYARDWGPLPPGDEDLLRRPRLLIAAIAVALISIGAVIAVTTMQIARTIDETVLADEQQRVSRLVAAYVERFGPLEARTVAGLGTLLSLDGLRLAQAVQPGPGETHSMLAPGEAVGGDRLIWRPHLYGSDSYAAFAPKRVPVGAFALMGLIALLYHLYRIADDLERRRRDAQRIAGHDALTGVANRLGFDTELRARFAALHDPFVLFCLDLDDFKAVNDRYGHGAGDVVLQQVALRLREIVGPEGFIGRLGGDEFVVLLKGDRTPEALHAVAHRMRASLALPYPVGPVQARVGVSIGVAEAPGQASSPEGLMAIGDAALYRAKSGQGNGVCFASLGERVTWSKQGAADHSAA